MFLRSSIFVAAGVAVLALVAGCGPKAIKRACMGSGTDNPLVSGAAMVRLDVYGANAHCADGATLQAGAGAPILSRSYAQGQPITADIPPGPHALVLSTYADADGLQLLGVGCTEGDLAAGSQICFDLTIVPGPDGGVDDLAAPSACTVTPNSCPSGSYCDGTTCRPGCASDNDCSGSATPDGGPPASKCDPTTHTCVTCLGGQKPCNGTCIPVDGCCTVSDCTAPPVQGCYTAACANPGGSCTYALKSGAQVCGTTCCLPINGTCAADCSLSCNSGFGDCDTSRTNGCEASTNTTANCGACGRACSTTNVATAKCTNGLCNSTCSAGWGNCVQPAAPTPDDGCETNTNTNVDNCGACGRACSGTNVATRSCANGLCNSTCNGGSGNCTQPAAPTADDGCETNTTNDPAHCGSCTKTCTAPPNETATCAASMCNVSCNSGFDDCDASSGNGCECHTDPAAPACCATTMCQTMHSNGYGGNYYDCNPLGQPGVSGYSSVMANEAALSYTGQSGTSSGGWSCTANGGTDFANSICKTAGSGNKGTCTCWVYDAGGAYLNRLGHTYHSSGVGSDTGCLCVLSTDPTWN